jgi:hypothetical protein
MVLPGIATQILSALRKAAGFMRQVIHSQR